MHCTHHTFKDPGVPIHSPKIQSQAQKNLNQVLLFESKTNNKKLLTILRNIHVCLQDNCVLALLSHGYSHCQN